jgi:putative FmdB family regulatory protein
MPIYEYQCDSEEDGCGYQFEVIQGLNDEPKKECPKCGKLKLKKLFGVPGLVFKGSGFYITDYKKPEQGLGGI